MRFFYTLALHLYALFAFPRLCLKGRKRLLARLGVDFPEIKKEGKKIAWVHAVSLGETKAVLPLLAKLKSEYRILLTTATATGHKEGLQSGLANWCAYLPFDLPYLIRPLVRRISPALLLLIETDFWYHFQDEAKKGGAKIVLINGKISSKSFARLRKIPPLCRLLFSTIDQFCLQSFLYKERFLQLGVAEDKISVTGNIKLDAKVEAPERSEAKILTLGSTHDPEERIWLESLCKLPSLYVYLAPRHPERFPKVGELLTRLGIAFGKWSEGATFAQYKVILVDQMGKLKECYRRSTLAFVGGTLTPHVGGHNILEPCLYGVPVLYGPHTYNQPEMAELAKRYDAGREISLENLVAITRSLLEDENIWQKLSWGGKRLLEESQGAVEKSYKILQEMVLVG